MRSSIVLIVLSIASSFTIQDGHYLKSRMQEPELPESAATDSQIEEYSRNYELWEYWKRSNMMSSPEAIQKKRLTLLNEKQSARKKPQLSNNSPKHEKDIILEGNSFYKTHLDAQPNFSRSMRSSDVTQEEAEIAQAMAKYNNIQQNVVTEAKFMGAFDEGYKKVTSKGNVVIGTERPKPLENPDTATPQEIGHYVAQLDAFYPEAKAANIELPSPTIEPSAASVSESIIYGLYNQIYSLFFANSAVEAPSLDPLLVNSRPDTKIGHHENTGLDQIGLITPSEYSRPVEANLFSADSSLKTKNHNIKLGKQAGDNQNGISTSGYTRPIESSAFASDIIITLEHQHFEHGKGSKFKGAFQNGFLAPPSPFKRFGMSFTGVQRPDHIGDIAKATKEEMDQYNTQLEAFMVEKLKYDEAAELDAMSRAAKGISPKVPYLPYSPTVAEQYQYNIDVAKYGKAVLRS